SGRNGGWLSGNIAGPRHRYAANGGSAGAQALQQAMYRAVDEVLEVMAEEGIDADQVKSGSLRVATTLAAESRLRAFVGRERQWGIRARDLFLLTADEVSDRLVVGGARLGAFTPHCARLHPAKLVAGLAAAAKRHGVMIYEHSPATEIESGVVRTTSAIVRA